jgi:hypothetical protein
MDKTISDIVKEHKESLPTTDEEWQAYYKPTPNNIGKQASWGGAMYETYGDEVVKVFKTDYHYVWTYIDGDDGGTYLVNGRCFINRIGYFICEVPWIEGDDICIPVISADDECDECESLRASGTCEDCLDWQADNIGENNE